MAAASGGLLQFGGGGAVPGAAGAGRAPAAGLQRSSTISSVRKRPVTSGRSPPRYDGHPTEAFVEAYVAAVATGAPLMALEAQLQRYVAFYTTCFSAGSRGDLKTFRRALQGCSLLLTCGGKAQRSACRLIQLASTAGVAVTVGALGALFSVVRDLALALAIYIGDDSGINNILIMLETIEVVVLRLAFTRDCNGMPEYDFGDLKHFQSQCNIVNDTLEELDVLDEPYIGLTAAGIFSALEYLCQARHDDDAEGAASCAVVAARLNCHTEPEAAAEEVMAVVQSIDKAIESNRLACAVVAVRLLGFAMSRSTTGLKAGLSCAAERLTAGTWPAPIVRAYVKALRQIGLAGATSSIRRIVLDPSIVASLGSISSWSRNVDNANVSTTDAGPAKIGTAMQEAARAIRTIQFAGAGEPAYSWLTDAASSVLQLLDEHSVHVAEFPAQEDAQDCSEPYILEVALRAQARDCAKTSSENARDPTRKPSNGTLGDLTRKIAFTPQKGHLRSVPTKSVVVTPGRSKRPNVVDRSTAEFTKVLAGQVCAARQQGHQKIKK